MDINPNIFFYFPHQSIASFRQIHELSEDQLWQKLIAHPVGTSGIAHWILQTYYYLYKAGLPCELVDYVPASGIIITHRDFLPVPVSNWRLVTSRTRTIVNMKVDRGFYHPADFTVVHNPKESRTSKRVIYVPPWPQIALKPRSGGGEAGLQSVGFIGNPRQLDPYFTTPAWTDFLKGLGLRWAIKPPYEWNDFSDIDLLVAVRQFAPIANSSVKPPLKLFNAWQAGVPIALSPESAYEAYRKTSLDYLEVRTPEEMQRIIKTFLDDPRVYWSYVQQSRANGERVGKDTVLSSWQDLIQKVVVPYHSAKSYKQIFTNQIKAVGVTGKYLLTNLIKR